MVHSYVKERREGMKLIKIENDQGIILKETKSIGEKAVKIFEHQFIESTFNDDYTILECIPKIILEGERERENMDTIPTKIKVRDVLFSLFSYIANGLDGFSGEVFQSC